jgi:membrane protein CcdC involved in cytochrome C biogenesis
MILPPLLTTTGLLIVMVPVLFPASNEFVAVTADPAKVMDFIISHVIVAVVIDKIDKDEFDVLKNMIGSDDVPEAFRVVIVVVVAAGQIM